MLEYNNEEPIVEEPCHLEVWVKALTDALPKADNTPGASWVDAVGTDPVDHSADSLVLALAN